MMVRAQIDDSPNVRILVLGPGLIRGVVFFGDVVDTALILFAVGVHHRSAVSAAGVAFTLHVPLFLAIAADHVGVAGPLLLSGAALTVGAAAGVFRGAGRG